MRWRRDAQESEGVFEVFSDMALLLLAAFIFLFALMLILFRIEGGDPQATREYARVKKELARTKAELARLNRELEQLAKADVAMQMDRVLAQAGLAKGEGRKDFELFVEGLRRLPGHTLHMVVDATGSMHGVTAFLIPVLRVIAIRSGKEITAISWFADGRTGTYQGTMAEMFDALMKNAPFVGADETIGHAFREIAEAAPVPSAYLLIGDEPPTDTVHYAEIPAPVFALPLGSKNDAPTRLAYERIARETGGRMLVLRFR